MIVAGLFHPSGSKVRTESPLDEERAPQMEPYGTGTSPDCFAAATSTFNCLIGQLTGSQAPSRTHDRLEEVIEETGRELLRQLLRGYLDLRALRELQAVAVARRQGACTASKLVHMV